MVGWHYPVNRHKFEQALEIGDGQGGLVCSSPWGHKESDVTEVTKVRLGLYEISRDSCAILKTTMRGQQTPGVQVSIVEWPGMRGQEGSRTRSVTGPDLIHHIYTLYPETHTSAPAESLCFLVQVQSFIY